MNKIKDLKYSNKKKTLTLYNYNDTTKNYNSKLDNDTESDTTNIINTAIQRRWYNGQHSCLPSS